MALTLPTPARINVSFGQREGALLPALQAWVGARGTAARIAPAVCFHPESTAQVIFVFDQPVTAPDGSAMTEAVLCLHWLDFGG
ncbi:MAG: hypothetical protein NTZ05_19815 [Chloroflexi bacterium]|nr:hypothetical protein [Chloroflexota bacterium]